MKKDKNASNKNMSSNPNASNPNTVRSATLTGFATAINDKVREKNEGRTNFMYVYNSCIRSRFKDLSACVAPDNVWVQGRRFKDLSASIAASNPNAVRSATLTGFATVINDKVRGRKEGTTGFMYNGFMRSELKVSMQGTAQDTAQVPRKLPRKLGEKK